MKHTLVALTALCVLATGCHESEKKSEKPAANHQIGNAANEVGGMNGTSGKLESETDRQVSESIRKALTDSNVLGQAAKNVRVHTRDGVVHLRGTVNSERDKQDIAIFVAKAPGVKKVENKIEVSKTSSGY